MGASPARTCRGAVRQVGGLFGPVNGKTQKQHTRPLPAAARARRVSAAAGSILNSSLGIQYGWSHTDVQTCGNWLPRRKQAVIGVLRAARLLFLAVAKCLSVSLIAFDDVIPVKWLLTLVAQLFGAT